MESSEHAEEWKRIAGSTQVLLRSRSEINAILQSIVDEGLPLLSHHQVRDRMFVARLHRVCDEEGFIVVGYSDNKMANAEIFAAQGVHFSASHRKGRVGFMAQHPVEQHNPAQSIRFDFPEILLIEQRRIDKRVRLIPDARLYCLADGSGITPFEARIVDIGLSGMGVMVYGPAIRLLPGTVLRGCRVDLPDGRVASLDIEIMHSTDFILLDGSASRRSGCRFIGAAREIEAMQKVFVLDLERADEDGG